MSDRTYVTLAAPGQAGGQPGQGPGGASATPGLVALHDGGSQDGGSRHDGGGRVVLDVPDSRYDAPAETLRVAGLTKLTTADWPGKLVATVFLQGCPWECTYCHNYELQDTLADGTLAWDDVVSFLKRRRGLLDAVVFSGGEPTMQDGLADAMQQVRDLGFAVGLHTGGPYPRRLAKVLPLVDWVGLDIKATAAKYEAITGKPNSARKAFAALDLVQASGVDFEVRTTVDPTVLNDADVVDLQAELARRGVGEHVVQQVREQGARPEYQDALAALRGA